MKRPKFPTASLHSVRQLSYQDGGAFVQEAYLFEHNGAFYLEVAAGYQQADESSWYKLENKPTKWPEDDGEFWADPHTDQSEKNAHGESDLFHSFGVHGETVGNPYGVSC